ncbi:Mitochondrial-processing peptidase subunit alpha [Psilocybe cubensis]|uniref:Alpha-MPP n=2 Tax=Psilocybe cubensis TaxID=181762 RepID=A0A8H7YA76_PSICU|nr:Mitochondrial-processing peptidase subunit alpha [Psilocybe cubensis]KAH9486284.1 Mitochondrial-processing peptidase subunit alpha [Psilocybe cubensis]
MRKGLTQTVRRSLSHASPPPTTQITTLPNKIRVATESTPGHFSSVGLYVDAGSRYETPVTSGVSHFLDRMAFKSTLTRSDEQMASDIHSLGGQIMCSSSRESIMYQSSHAHKGTPLALSLIADTVLNPAFRAEELEAQRDAASYEIREINAKPEMILPEILHAVAYNNQGLGNPLLCPEDRIPAMNDALLRHSITEWYRPERMVIAGAGMPHQELVELVDKYFSSLKPSSATASPQAQTSRISGSAPVPPHLLGPSTPGVAKSLTRAASYLFPQSLTSTSTAIPKSPTSTYTGGYRFIHDPTQELNHLYIAYEGVGINDDDVYALATMQVLLGGGGSFSAGGPGKGMYSRLYTHILNYYTQIEHCASFHHIYNDSSLFGLFASFVPAASGLSGGNTPAQILPHLVNQLSMLLYSPLPDVELQRAKNQLTSSLMMALESRAIEVEDLGRQMLVHNRKVPVTEMTEQISKVTQNDIKRVANRIFGPDSGSKPTVVCMGHEDLGSAWRKDFATYRIAD